MPDLGDLPWPQLMARALGARVYPTGGKVDLPRGATLLASTGLCPNQAYAWGPNAVGFQFHPEAAAARLEQWFIGHAARLRRPGFLSRYCALTPPGTHRALKSKHTKASRSGASISLSGRQV